MKKAQILSAIALAFALGVVAPVAGLANAIDHEKPEATCEEVNHMIDAIEQTNPTYVKIAAVIKAVSDYGTADPAATVKTAITSALSALNTAGVDTSYQNGANVTLRQIINDAINNTEDYSIYLALYNAIEAKNVSKFQDAVEAYNKIDGVSPIITDLSWANWDAVKADTAVTADSGATWKFQNYDEYEDLIDAVKDADTADKKFDEGKKALTKALKDAGVKQDLIDAETTLAGLATLADETNIKGFDDYTILNTKINAAGNCSKNTTAAAAYTYADDIAKALKDADSTYARSTAAQVIDILLGTAITTPNNPDEPGTEQPGTEEPGSEDPSAPGTGLVSTAEGNAATTVSIVAGLATALTALGAGVVAYRSARRSNK